MTGSASLEGGLGRAELLCLTEEDKSRIPMSTARSRRGRKPRVRGGEPRVRGRGAQSEGRRAHSEGEGAQNEGRGAQSEEKGSPE